MDEELKIMLLSEAATITALVDEIEHGDNDPHEFLDALRQVSYRLRQEVADHEPKPFT